MEEYLEWRKAESDERRAEEIRRAYIRRVKCAQYVMHAFGSLGYRSQHLEIISEAVYCSLLPFSAHLGHAFYHRIVPYREKLMFLAAVKAMRIHEEDARGDAVASIGAWVEAME